jgi:hypothetical protein
LLKGRVAQDSLRFKSSPRPRPPKGGFFWSDAWDLGLDFKESHVLLSQTIILISRFF